MGTRRDVRSLRGVASEATLRLARGLIKWSLDNRSGRESRLSPRYQRILNKTLHSLELAKRQVILEQIAPDEYIVQAGPFAGMQLTEKVSWGDGDIVPKLLGTYEQELHPALQRVSAKGCDRVVNIGCAEGYYAVGLARLLPRAEVIAIDLDPQAIRLCEENARLNGVLDRLHPRGPLDSDELARLLVETPRSLVFADCEGAELKLLQPSVFKAGSSTAFVIECHDLVSPGTTQILLARLLGSHEVEVVTEGPRDPNAIACLRGLRSLDRWIAVSEGRPLTMHWLYARPKQDSDEAALSDG